MLLLTTARSGQARSPSSLADARKIWDFGPEGVGTLGTNILADKSKGVQYLNEVNDSLKTAFQAATRDGPLCAEELRGVKYNIMDVKLHSDSAHRGARQIEPAARRAFFGSLLSAQPRLLEPIYLVEIQTDEATMGAVYGVLSARRGHVFSSERQEGTPLFNMRAFLPVKKSFGFSAALLEATRGSAFPQCVFDHWEVMPGDPMQADTLACKAMLAARKRKGMKAEIPIVADFIDKL